LDIALEKSVTKPECLNRKFFGEPLRSGSDSKAWDRGWRIQSATAHGALPIGSGVVLGRFEAD